MILPCISAKKRHGTVFPHYIHTQIDLVVVDENDACPSTVTIQDNWLPFATFPIAFTEASDSISIRIKEGELKQIYQLHHCSDTSAQPSITVPCRDGAKVKLVASPLHGVQLPGFVFWFHVVSGFVYTSHESECVLC